MIATRGRIGALLDLGWAFTRPDRAENVFINGVISGLTRREVQQRFEEMVSFAELEDFSTTHCVPTARDADAPGILRCRHTNPEILLIDEVLAVGDVASSESALSVSVNSKRTLRHLAGLARCRGVRRLCDDVLWLRKGKLAAHGPAEMVVSQYLDEMR